jgi:hypothetical protein
VRQDEGRRQNKILLKFQPKAEEVGIHPRENICWSLIGMQQLWLESLVHFPILNLWMHSHLYGCIYPWGHHRYFQTHSDSSVFTAVVSRGYYCSLCSRGKDSLASQKSCFAWRQWLIYSMVLPLCMFILMGLLILLRGVSGSQDKSEASGWSSSFPTSYS